MSSSAQALYPTLVSKQQNPNINPDTELYAPRPSLRLVSDPSQYTNTEDGKPGRFLTPTDLDTVCYHEGMSGRTLPTHFAEVLVALSAVGSTA